MPRRRRNQKRKFSFVLDNACDEQTKPLVRIALQRIIGSFVTGLFQNIQEQTKALVFVFEFVFVLVDEQAISI